MEVFTTILFTSVCGYLATTLRTMDKRIDAIDVKVTAIQCEIDKAIDKDIDIRESNDYYK